jgi:hypothetical protein
MAEVPRRAVYPLKIAFVAYQYGGAVEPLIQSVEPVVHEILVRK